MSGPIEFQQRPIRNTRAPLVVPRDRPLEICACVMLCPPEIETRAFMIGARMLASGVTGTVGGGVPRRRLGQELTSVRRARAAFARPWDPGARSRACRSRALPRWSYRAILNA